VAIIPVRHAWGLDGDLAGAIDGLHALGYRGLECWVGHMHPELRRRLRDLGWTWIAIGSTGPADARTGPATHRSEFRRWAAQAAALDADLINLHAGVDAWDDGAAAEFLAGLCADAAGLGVALACETHRGRILHTPWRTLALCRRVPDLRLTADYSHFAVVCERLLDDQGDTLAALAPRVVHFHARVGSAQGPQVPDPFAAGAQSAVAAHLGWWDGILDARRAAGLGPLTVVPEFGPPPYAHTDPGSGVPLVDVPSVCDGMMRRLCGRYGTAARAPAPPAGATDCATPDPT
jgi:sugar phosphate isomerase/epimerase